MRMRQRRELRYGERWQCEGCGRGYDTNKIPLEEYAAMHRNRVRDRILPVNRVLRRWRLQ